MSIVETISRPTHRSLMNKSKDDLATLVMQLMEINARLEKIHKDQCQAAERAFVEYEKQIATLKAQRDTAYGYGSDEGEPPWMK